MTRISFILSIAVVAAPLSVVVPARATSCAAPEISVTPAQVAVGDDIEVLGRNWNGVCPGPDTIGCWGGSAQEDRPIQDIQLILVNRGTKERYPLGTVDADERMGFSLTVSADVPPGWYVVKDARGESYVSNETKLRVVSR